MVSENHKYLRTVSKTLRKKSTLAELSRKSSRYPLYYFDLLTTVVHYPFSSHHAIQILDGPWTNSFAVCCCYNVCHYEQFTKVYYKWTRQKNCFLKLSSLVKKLSQSVICHDHSKAFPLPTGKETAESLLTLANFTRKRSFDVEYKLDLCNSSVKPQRTHCNCILVYGRKELVFKHPAVGLCRHFDHSIRLICFTWKLNTNQ